MPDHLEVSPDRLCSAAPKFDDASQGLTDALAELRSVLSGVAATMCGDDEQGREFAAGYEPAAKTIDESLEFAALGVAAIAKAVGDSGEKYADCEDTNVHATRINGGV